MLLAGDNPRIAKGLGAAPVRAYVAAIPGWKRGVVRRLDALIVRTVPRIRKAVKWNSPLYGLEGRGWCIGVHLYARFVRIAFFEGRRLRPMPPGPSKVGGTRYLDLREGDSLGPQLARWIRAASRLPGRRL